MGGEISKKEKSRYIISGCILQIPYSVLSVSASQEILPVCPEQAT